MGAAYAGENDVELVEVSTDNGDSWQPVEFLGPHEPFAWRQWQYQWQAEQPGKYTILSRATDSSGTRQPTNATWNKLGYGNNGIKEHGVTVTVE